MWLHILVTFINCMSVIPIDCQYMHSLQELSIIITTYRYTLYLTLGFDFTSETILYSLTYFFKCSCLFFQTLSWIWHVNVWSCLLINFQYNPICLQYSWLSVIIPILTCPMVVLLAIHKNWNRSILRVVPSIYRNTIRNLTVQITFRYQPP